jgi:21S rRNA (GM2251-2'-O)-methyltransferase
MGFRGKAGKIDPNDPREKYRRRQDIPEWKSPPKEDLFEQNSDDRSSYFRKDSNRSSYRTDEAHTPKNNGAKPAGRISGWSDNRQARGEDGPAAEPRRGRFGEIIGVPRRIKVTGRDEKGKDSRGRDGRGRDERGQDPKGRAFNSRGDNISSSKGGPWERKRFSTEYNNRAPRSIGRFSERSSPQDDLQDNPLNTSSKHGSSFSGSTFSFRSRGDRDEGNFPRSSEAVLNFYNKSIGSKETIPAKPKFTQTIDNRIPLSIPYTTPASEFLYGTSVVEAALSSRREPRRKLYKLYIYAGENREDANRDAKIERMAQKNRVPVMRVGNDWARLMDKMSAGRPHNGFILEASPLPRLPVLHLGELKTVDGQHGFEVAVDHQSREEAAVNGTASFVKATSNSTERKPFVLLLDSIVDPGNLGGIIRTASFFGVSAIAISARNSAPFSPIVLKASAGASENVTLFTVNKPAGFIVDSKANGWRVFAAVAPSKKGDPAMPVSISTDDLDDPLSEAPCILMLGSEGEGLRWNLRSKADVDLYIRGSGKSHNVDSLNVSVATGILCNSFLRSHSKKESGEVEQVLEIPNQLVFQTPAGNLF